MGLRWTQKATWSGGGSLTHHTPEVRVRLGGVPIWRMRKNVVTPYILQVLLMLRTVDTIIVSDVHLGSTISRARDLQRTLEAYRCERLILLGDIFHDLTDASRLSKDQWDLLGYILALSCKRYG